MQTRKPPHLSTLVRHAAIAAPIAVGAFIVAVELTSGADPLAVGLTLIVLGAVAATTVIAVKVLNKRLTRLEQGLARVTGMQQQHDDDLMLLAAQQRDATLAMQVRVERATEGPRGTEPSGANRLN
ncbi:hypothetical protein [Actinomadura hibisca]|uniref:hypothetical protein n=1 Tax=Actinomadura hibisca TaxID=68565 RepID=UPI00082DBE32|nr:hypothetical protein [Actinomadura hibisca]